MSQSEPQAELVGLGVDVIFAPAEAALRASLQASRTVPIVMAAVEYDPIDLGLVTSIARPGGNVTGVIFNQVETSGKRVELLKDAVPGLARVAVLIESGGKFQLGETERAARSLGISFRIIELGVPPDFDRVFKAALNEQAGAIIVLVSPATYAQRATIASLAIKNQIPAIAPFSEFAEAGGLLSYGASFASMFHYAAYYVDRILRGTSPAELPIEQPTRFELCINLKTARALGLTIAHSLLITGLGWLGVDLGAKRLELLRELVPTGVGIAMLANPNNPDSEFEIRDVQEAARILGRQIHVVSAGSDADFDGVFAMLVKQQTSALIVATDAYFSGRRGRIVALATRYAVPTIYDRRDFADSGGLISYGHDRATAYRQLGIYTGRILKGAKPADLPVLQPTKFELVINLNAAKALGIDVPATLLARADEVIE
jgi:ABC-type uncharacterized transport system substrate-binding protein